MEVSSPSRSAIEQALNGNVLPATAGALPVAPSSGAVVSGFSKVLASAAAAPDGVQAARAAASAAEADGVAGPAEEPVKTARATPSWLTDPEAAQASKPNMAEFMAATGVDPITSSELLYGVVGSNMERRNWAAIMKDTDPLSATRLATRALYGDTAAPKSTDKVYLKPESTAAREGHFALTKDGPSAPLAQPTYQLMLVDANGLLLRHAGSDSQTIQRNAWLFGFELKDATQLAPAAQATAPALAQVLREADCSESIRRTALQDRSPVEPEDTAATVEAMTPVFEEFSAQAPSTLDVLRSREDDAPRGPGSAEPVRVNLANITQAVEASAFTTLFEGAGL